MKFVLALVLGFMSSANAFFPGPNEFDFDFSDSSYGASDTFDFEPESDSYNDFEEYQENYVESSSCTYYVRPSAAKVGSEKTVAVGKELAVFIETNDSVTPHRVFFLKLESGDYGTWQQFSMKYRELSTLGGFYGQKTKNYENNQFEVDPLIYVSAVQRHKKKIKPYNYSRAEFLIPEKRLDPHSPSTAHPLDLRKLIYTLPANGDSGEEALYEIQTKSLTIEMKASRSCN